MRIKRAHQVDDEWHLQFLEGPFVDNETGKSQNGWHKHPMGTDYAEQYEGQSASMKNSHERIVSFLKESQSRINFLKRNLNKF